MRLALKLPSLSVRTIIVLFVLVLIIGWSAHHLMQSSQASKHVVRFVRSAPDAIDLFGDIREVAIVKVTDYGDRRSGRATRQYVVIVEGSMKSGRLTILDSDPGGVHEYRIARAQ